MTAAVRWAADLSWDLKKGAVDKELHLQLRRTLLEASARFRRDNLPSHDQQSPRFIVFNRIADFAARADAIFATQGTSDDD